MSSDHIIVTKSQIKLKVEGILESGMSYDVKLRAKRTKNVANFVKFCIVSEEKHRCMRKVSEFGALSLLPPLLVITLCSITKEVVLSLFLGIFRAELLAWVLGMVVFFSDYAYTAIV